MGKREVIKGMGRGMKELYGEKGVLYVCGEVFEVEYREWVGRKEFNDLMRL